MPYVVIWSDRAKDDLRRFDKKTTERVIAKVESIKETPLAFIKRLSGVELFSLRVGEYRVILDVKGNKMIIFVIKIRHRKEVYRDI